MYFFISLFFSNRTASNDDQNNKSATGDFQVGSLPADLSGRAV
jgi:hypothetical protein